MFVTPAEEGGRLRGGRGRFSNDGSFLRTDAVLAQVQWQSFGVRVVALRTVLNTSAIAASLQHDARFAKPAYYINAMFAMVVRFGNTSSPCERGA